MTTITGTTNADTLNGSDAADTIKGLGGADRLVGGGGKDALYGGAGDDRFSYGSLAEIVAGEIVDGGNGIDTLRLAVGVSAQAANLATMAITSIERLEISARAGAILKPGQIAQFHEIIGNVRLASGGTATFSGAMSKGAFLLGNAATTFDASTNTSVGGITIKGGAAADVITGGTGHDTLSGGAGNDTLNGGAGNDVLNGGPGVDKINGGAGDDRIIVIDDDGATGQVYDGGDGFDSIEISGIGPVDLTRQTLRGIESITASAASPAVITLAQIGGLQEMHGSFQLSEAGAITLAGKAYSDFVLTLAIGSNTLDATALHDDVMVVGNEGNDTIKGGTGVNTLLGRLGNDTLTGNAGDDFLIGGTGKDALYGQAGDDTFYVDSENDLVAGEVIDGGAGNDLLSISTAFGVDLSGVTLTSVERLDAVFAPGIKLTIAQLSRFSSLPQARYMLADGGTATLTATVADNATFLLSDFGNTLDLRGVQTTSVQVTGGRSADTVWGTSVVDQINLWGGNDTAYGMGGADKIDGGEGNDRIEGGDGNDQVIGGAGDDTLIGGAGDDNLQGDGGNDRIEGGDGADALIGHDGDDTLIGGAGADALLGMTGSDTLSGSDGNDRLTGGSGNDTLTGGAGADTFTFADGEAGTTRTATDAITDFNHAQGDRIDLSAIDADGTKAGDQAFALVSGTFTAAGQIHVVQAGGTTYVEGNTNANTLADFVIQLSGTVTLVGADFVL